MAATFSLSSDNEGKDHDYQVLKKPGPRGAYEARQVNGGFYVRVDMPGVPPDGVKLFKRGETNTVTFNGKAPRLWPYYEDSDRVYGGYVVLDRNPNEIDVVMNVVNGSLKLFFPNSDGLLHFFAPKKLVPQQSQDSIVEHLGDEKKSCHNKFVQSMDDTNTTIPGHPGLKTMGLHQSGCRCGNKSQMTEGVYGLNELRSTHINPFLLDGTEGVADSLRIVDATGDSIYMRVDMPGLGEKNGCIRLENGVILLYEGEGELEYPFDQGVRTYSFGFMVRCTCCSIVDVKHAVKDGVVRVSFRRCTISSSSGKDCKFALLTARRSVSDPRSSYSG